MKKIIKICSSLKKSMNDDQYIIFLKTMKNYCETKINSFENKEYKLNLLKFFEHDKNICEFINFCNVDNKNNEISQQRSSTFENKTILKNENIFISIITSSLSSDNFGNGPEEIEISIGKNECEQIEILKERCVCSNETYDYFLSQSEFKNKLNRAFGKIKKLIINCDDLYKIIQTIVKIDER